MLKLRHALSLLGAAFALAACVPASEPSDETDGQTVDAASDSDMAEPDPDAAVPQPDGSAPEPDAARLDAVLPDPDGTMPDPDAAVVDADAAEPEPDAAELEPDAAEPELDAAEPGPDATEREPDAAEPEPDAGCVPIDERCNGADDDCDGAIDEDFDLDAPCEAGVGACLAAGRTVCADDGGTTCDAEPGDPDEEACNGADDDCDGASDEGLAGMPCPSDGQGACAAGVTACVDGVPSCQPAVEPSDERCDGIDNDCNGSVDDLPGAGDPCTMGVGACEADGVLACSPRGLACNAMPDAPGDEACNGEDDDCNGVVDDIDRLGQPCTVGVGACEAAGRIACGPGEPVCAGQPLAPADEVCDGTDNDCDGLTDEGPACGPEVCDNALDDDGDGQSDCLDDDCAFDAACVPEVCDNGVDDDDNGAVDCDDAFCADQPICVHHPIPPPGLFNTLDSFLDRDSPTYNRQGDRCLPLDRPDRRYRAFSIVNRTGADRLITLHARWRTADGFLFVYAHPFVPEEPQAGCVEGNNNFQNIGESQITELFIGRGEVLDVVATTFEPEVSMGPFQIAVTTLEEVPGAEVCDNGEDDDGDRRVDCDDPGCFAAPGCEPIPEVCDNGVDDDGDRAVDCNDSDCDDVLSCARCPVVDFEDGEIPARFGASGDAGWFVEDGAATSSAIDDAQSSGLTLDVDTPEGGRVEFAVRASSDFLDMLTFHIDGLEVDRWRLDQRWLDVSYRLQPGAHELEWRYTKNENLSGGEDRGQIDDIAVLGALACTGEADRAIAALGGTIALEGQLDVDSPLFTRPTAACAGARPNRRYQVFSIVNRTGEAQTLDILATWNAGDGLLLVYRDFDPADGLAGCVDGNDDIAPGDTSGSRLPAVPIGPGEVLDVVATTFGEEADLGPFVIEVTTGR